MGRDVRNLWQARVDAFVRDHKQPNPYVLPTSGESSDGYSIRRYSYLTGAPTEAEMRLALKREEEEEVRLGKRRLYATSATAFLSAGIQLEDAQ